MAMEIGVSAIPVSEVRTDAFPARVQWLTTFGLVLLQRTHGSGGKLHPLCILQRPGHIEGSRGAPAEPQEVLGIEVTNEVIYCIE
jgi:hypothetical protein